MMCFLQQANSLEVTRHPPYLVNTQRSHMTASEIEVEGEKVENGNF